MHDDPPNPAPGTLFEAQLTLPDGETVHIVGASEEPVLDLAASMDAAYARQESAKAGTIHADTPAPPDVSNICRGASRDLLDALGPLDPLDALTMLLWTLAPDLSDPHESTNTIWDSLALTEPVALAALAKDSLTGDPASPVEPYLTDTRASAAGILDLAVQEGLWQFSRANGAPADPSSYLASQLAGHERAVRGRQYETVALQINYTVLGSPRASAALKQALGFDYDAITAVRTALHEASDDLSRWLLDSMERRRAELTQHSMTGDLPTSAAMTPEYGPQQARQLRTVTTEQVAGLAHLGEQATRSVLEFFSVAPFDQPLATLIQNYVCGDNPLRQRQLLHTGDEQFFLMADGILPDEIRRTCEAAMKSIPKVWTKYESARSVALEDLTLAAFQQLLPGASLHPTIKYRFARQGEDLSQTSTTAASADLAEADLLVLVDGVVLCVEAKAGEFTERGR